MQLLVGFAFTPGNILSRTERSRLTSSGNYGTFLLKCGRVECKTNMSAFEQCYHLVEVRFVSNVTVDTVSVNYSFYYCVLVPPIVDQCLHQINVCTRRDRERQRERLTTRLKYHLVLTEVIITRVHSL